MQPHSRSLSVVYLFILFCSFYNGYANDPITAANINLPMSEKKSAFFATYSVTSLADAGAGTLREAINLANTGTGSDIINILVGGTIALESTLNITNGMTINGLDPGKSIVSGNNTVRVFLITAESFYFILNMNALTIANGNCLKVTDNFSGAGGGINSSAPGSGLPGGLHTLNIQNCIFSGNEAVNGGALWYQTGRININNCTFSNNRASDAGGAALIDYKCGFHIDNSTFSGCSASMGGALYCSDVGTIRNCTISGNNVKNGNGGGIYHYYYAGALTLTNCTITGNTAGNGGGIYSWVPGQNTLIIANTIIAGNTASSGPDVLTQPTHPILSGGHNFIGKMDGSQGWILSDLLGTIAGPIDPKLGILANNGGPTQTIALLSGSPAIDGGGFVCLAGTDQRGVSRPQGVACDIGAFEHEYKIKFLTRIPNIYDKWWRLHLWGPYMDEFTIMDNIEFSDKEKKAGDPLISDISLLSWITEISGQLKDKELKEKVQQFILKTMMRKIGTKVK